MSHDFSAFEQRPDNSLWLFYKLGQNPAEQRNDPADSSRGTREQRDEKVRLRKAYVLAYTWHEARAGAMAAFHRASSATGRASSATGPASPHSRLQRDEPAGQAGGASSDFSEDMASVSPSAVEGKEIKDPEECLVEAGSTVVFVPINPSLPCLIVETSVVMSGADLRQLSKKPSVLPMPHVDGSFFPKLESLVDKVIPPASLTSEMVHEMSSSEETSNGKAQTDGEIFQTIQQKMLRLKKSSTYGLVSIEEEDSKEICTNCGDAGYRHAGSGTWTYCVVCNNNEQIPMSPPEMREAVSQLCNEVRELRDQLNLGVALKYSRTFEDAWKAWGSDYGPEALRQVRLGWDLRGGTLSAGEDDRVTESTGTHITQDFLRGLVFAAEKCKREAAVLEAHKNISGLTHHALGRLEAYNAMEEHFRTLSEPRNSHTPPLAGQAKDGE